MQEMLTAPEIRVPLALTDFSLSPQQGGGIDRQYSRPLLCVEALHQDRRSRPVPLVIQHLRGVAGGSPFWQPRRPIFSFRMLSLVERTALAVAGTPIWEEIASAQTMERLQEEEAWVLTSREGV